MKVKVRFSKSLPARALRGAAVPKPAEEDGRWQDPPRYEVLGRETSEKVVPIRLEAHGQKAEVLPIRPGKSREPEVVTPAELVHALAHLLNPASVLALALGVWSFFADLGMANSFAIPEGAFSHWQTWVAVAGAIQFFNRSLQRRFVIPAEQAGADSPADSNQ